MHCTKNRHTFSSFALRRNPSSLRFAHTIQSYILLPICCRATHYCWCIIIITGSSQWMIAIAVGTTEKLKVGYLAKTSGCMWAIWGNLAFVPSHFFIPSWPQRCQFIHFLVLHTSLHCSIVNSDYLLESHEVTANQSLTCNLKRGIEQNNGQLVFAKAFQVK